MAEKQMVTGVNDIRQRLGITESTFIKMVQSGELPAKKNKANVFEIEQSVIDKMTGRVPVEETETKGKIRPK